MYDHLHYVMDHAIEERQRELRQRGLRHDVIPMAPPSWARRATGEALIRLGERLRGELRDATVAPVPARSELATS